MVSFFNGEQALDYELKVALADGAKVGLQAGRKQGFDYGHKLGLEEGRKLGLEEGLAKGMASNAQSSDAVEPQVTRKRGCRAGKQRQERRATKARMGAM